MAATPNLSSYHQLDRLAYGVAKKALEKFVGSESAAGEPDTSTDELADERIG